MGRQNHDGSTFILGQRGAGLTMTPIRVGQFEQLSLRPIPLPHGNHLSKSLESLVITYSPSQVYQNSINVAVPHEIPVVESKI